MAAMGNEHDAWVALMVAHGMYCTCGCEIDDNNMRLIGTGESRAAWLVNGVVYKIARRASANTYEHEMLTAWRKAGAKWAPETSLYEFELYGDPEPVVAMPYLPDDCDLDEATVAEIRRAAPQTCMENWMAHGGQTWLIDGQDIEYLPEHLGITPPTA